MFAKTIQNEHLQHLRQKTVYSEFSSILATISK